MSLSLTSECTAHQVQPEGGDRAGDLSTARSCHHPWPLLLCKMGTGVPEAEHKGRGKPEGDL